MTSTGPAASMAGLLDTRYPGRVELFDIGTASYDRIRERVGGWLEYVQPVTELAELGVVAYCNEEARVDLNLAEHIRVLNWASMPVTGGGVWGPIVLTGSKGADTAGLPPAAIAWLARHGWLDDEPAR